MNVQISPTSFQDWLSVSDASDVPPEAIEEAARCLWPKAYNFDSVSWSPGGKCWRFQKGSRHVYIDQWNKQISVTDGFTFHPCLGPMT